jgi:V8-like Glu-specific endopeptidase
MNLAETKNVCSDETFSDISSIGLCSGFLVGEDLLVTAGHCMSTSRDCEEAIWAFNFQKDSISSKDHILEGKDVYHCKKIINQQLSGVSYNDFAIIQLDRKVEGRAPLKFRTSGKVENDAELVVIGHPSGLPTMITDGAYIRNNDNDFYFVTNSDTFGGNSGSAVFNSKTGEVEGILVRGENDYVFDEEAECYRPYKCGIDECRGEDVTRITVIPELVPGMTPVEPEPTANQLIEFFQLWMTNMTGQQLYLLWFASLTSAEIIDMTIEQTMEQSYNLWIESLDPTELYELWYQYIFLFS